ncbi:MAG: type II secretion system minor pseudopilin GspJ [Gammaproteobacteria bacterium]|nr:type II secretion system minor pseudopilin GspJ [Gammaproteobacteria bacterium]
MKGVTRKSGFTLIELLVAMLIFAVLGTAAYQGLFQVQRVKAGVELQSERLTRLQRTFYWLTDDLSQLADRPIRTTLGSLEPAFRYNETGESLLEFTRSGWSNPAADVTPPRSTLQRVAYSLDDDRLIRRYWYHLDRLESDTAKRRVLLDDVASVEMRFMDAEGDWHQTWPPPSQEEGPQLPTAIEITLELEQFGSITRLFAPRG